MPRILVVDDEPDSLLAARAALTGAGHDCVLAPDGPRALAFLSAGRFDVIVVDPAMPLHDGWPVLAAAGATPVVAVTSAPPGLGGRPVAAHLPKPCAADDLVATVAAVLADAGAAG